MKFIKLDAIDSTNDFLKGYYNQNRLENFTVVTSESQSNGKGQMGTKWLSESGKNLIVSVLIKDIVSEIDKIFDLNVVISISILEALKKRKIPNLSIKWPNDIMSGNKKIAGILIENIIKSDKSIASIVGFGLNVNQSNFENLPKASSLKNIIDQEIDKEILLLEILDAMKKNLADMNEDKTADSWNKYNRILFKKAEIMPFEYKNGQKFMGIIQNVARNGKINLLTENDQLQTFEIKEILMIY